MEKQKTEDGCASLILFDVGLALMIWGVLIILKACGVIGMHWALVLFGIVWISWGLFALSALVLWMMPLYIKLRKRIRRRKRDRKIKRQAKALGVWEAPNILGGRALELKAWDEYRLLREDGETDAQLRGRMAEIQRKAKS